MARKKICKRMVTVVVAAITTTGTITVAIIESRGKMGNEPLSTLSFELEDNSGVIIPGDNSGDISVINNYGDHDDKEKEEKVTLTGELHGYSVGNVEDEQILIYHDYGYETLYEFRILNENEITIDIQNLYVEVLDYKDFNEFIIRNPAGGANLHKIIFWSCNITPEKKKYPAMLIGTDENNVEDLSKTEYVSITSSDSGEFKVKIFPDTSGLYEAKVIVEYSSYEGKTKRVESENIKFIYDPENEGNYEYISY